MTGKNAGMLVRARYSLAGLALALREERSLRSHVLLSAVLFAAMAAIRPAAYWWPVMILAVASGWAMELANAAIERLCDRLHPGRHEAIGAVKDLASAAAFVVNCATGILALAMLAATLQA